MFLKLSCSCSVSILNFSISCTVSPDALRFVSVGMVSILSLILDKDDSFISTLRLRKSFSSSAFRKSFLRGITVRSEYRCSRRIWYDPGIEHQSHYVCHSKSSSTLIFSDEKNKNWPRVQCLKC